MHVHGCVYVCLYVMLKKWSSNRNISWLQYAAKVASSSTLNLVHAINIALFVFIYLFIYLFVCLFIYLFICFQICIYSIYTGVRTKGHNNPYNPYKVQPLYPTPNRRLQALHSHCPHPPSPHPEKGTKRSSLNTHKFNKNMQFLNSLFCTWDK